MRRAKVGVDSKYNVEMSRRLVLINGICFSHQILPSWRGRGQGEEPSICVEGRRSLDLPNFQPLERGVQPG